jgi:hypothetical protein
MRFSSSKGGFIVISILILIVTGSFYGSQQQSKPEVSIYPASELTARELAGLLGVHVWKMNVLLPENIEKVNLHLEVKEKGKTSVKSFGPGITPLIRPGSPREVLIAIIPLNEDISNTDKVRVIINAFGAIASGLADNPLKNMGIGGPTFPQKTSDGTFALIGGYKGNTIATPISETADVLISLKIELE